MSLQLSSYSISEALGAGVAVALPVLAADAAFTITAIGMQLTLDGFLAQLGYPPTEGRIKVAQGIHTLAMWAFKLKALQCGIRGKKKLVDLTPGLVVAAMHAIGQSALAALALGSVELGMLSLRFYQILNDENLFGFKNPKFAILSSAALVWAPFLHAYEAVPSVEMKVPVIFLGACAGCLIWNAAVLHELHTGSRLMANFVEKYGLLPRERIDNGLR